MRFELYVAARYLKAKRRQAVVGVVTVISVAGVTAGVAALIIALAITNGMRRDLQDKLLGSSAHVQLMQVEGNGIPRLAAAFGAFAPGAARNCGLAGLVRAGGRGARRARWLRADRRNSAGRRTHRERSALDGHPRSATRVGAAARNCRR